MSDMSETELAKYEAQLERVREAVTGSIGYCRASQTNARAEGRLEALAMLVEHERRLLSMLEGLAR